MIHITVATGLVAHSMREVIRVGEISRRSVTRGAAWAAPVIAVSASAPAVAASGVQPSINRIFTITRATGCGSGAASLSVVSNNDGSSYYQIVNAKSSTTVTQVMASVLVNVSGLKFTTSTGNWGPVQQDPQTYTYNGTVYYRYYSSLAVAVPAVSGGTITIPRLSWTSACLPALVNPVMVNGRGTATINGTQQVQIGVFRSI